MHAVKAFAAAWLPKPVVPLLNVWAGVEEYWEVTEVQFAAMFKIYPQQFPVAHWLLEVQSEPAAQLVPDEQVEVVSVERELI